MIELKTPRLFLRQFKLADFKAYADLCSDPEVMKYMGGPQSKEEAWRHMAMLLGHWQLLGYGMWAVQDRESGEMIGRVGFINPEGWPGFEIGWALSKSHWNKGYATEAAREALKYGINELGKKRIISLIHPENRASRRVSEKIGGRLEKSILFKGAMTELYVIES